jgi:hypothetical protein
MFADFALFRAAAVVVLELDVFNVARAFCREVFHVCAYPQKLAAHADALEDPPEELCVEAVDAGAA